MIFCLVTIPLAALFGTSLPDIVKTLGFVRSTDSAREQGGEAPLFVANIPNAAAAPDYPPTGQEPDAFKPAGNEPKAEMPPQFTQTPNFPAAQASFNEPAPVYGGSNVNVNPGYTERPGERPGDERPVVPVSVGQSGGRFEKIQERLKTLGASYFRLESFGSAGQFYRFQCEIPIGGDGAVRHFEATSINSFEAMESVLSEVDRWMKNE